MQPLKITAVLQTGQVATIDGLLPLDSILAAEWIRQNHPKEYYAPKRPGEAQGTGEDLIEADLPFDRRGNWYYACSFNRGVKLGEYIVYWHKRFDDQMEQYLDFGGRRGKIDVKSGKFKSYRMPLVVMLFDRLIWYAVGDGDAVLELCRGVTHVGKKTSQGRGAIEQWIVEPWEEDWSERDGEGKITRALPATEYSGGLVRRYGLRPPYWYRDNQALCHIPEVITP